MTSLGLQANNAKIANTSSPGWRPLAALAALVVIAHALVLQASPAQLGSGADANAKTFTIRSIQATPAPAAVPAPVAAPKVVKSVKTSPKNTSNQPPDQQIRAQAAPEIIAPAEPVSAPQAVAEIPVDSAASATPTQVVAAPAPSPETTPVTAISLPASVRLQYKVIGLSKNLNYHATAELNWKTDGDTYDAMMKVSAFLVGSRSMTSVGKITGSGLAPTRFADKFRSELAAHFEADKGKIIFSANTPDAPWIEGVQDRVSVFLQLAGMLATNPAGFPPGSNITFLTIGPREADSWTFIIEAAETLDLMNAPMLALKLTRKPRKEFDQKVEIWFAPSLGYLPVRSRITQHGGDFIDQQLTEISKSL
jgi:hypothetical protein